VANRIDNHTWRIVEDNTVNIYLVEGTDSALIIDTGYGTGDLKEFVHSLTSLPVIVVNTHGHGDHTGNDKQFSRIYAHPDDFGMINNRFKDMEEIPVLIPLKEGQIIDLGDRKLEVIEVPGHTHGSICLIDTLNKVLFAGDNTNGIVWLFLKDCYPLEVYLNSLQKIEQRIKGYNIIMPGHNEPLDKSFIADQITCVKSILDGTCSPVPYEYSSISKGALLCTYKTAQVAYNPDNLFK
jgi:glyoxylase-like metal-dependent hydrolase (beta-lactamase superfamily II)